MLLRYEPNKSHKGELKKKQMIYPPKMEKMT